MCTAACEEAVLPPTGNSGNVTLRFTPSVHDVTRSNTDLGSYFTKLNVMLFDAEGNKVWDKVRTQLSTDDSFGTLTASLAPDTYTIVAVGHSSAVSATIKSTDMVQFTARDGEKLTDTFCYCGTLTIGDSPEQYSLTMHRAGAMFRLVMTDASMPAFSSLRLDYTGGSANFNPQTLEGNTKSTQSETRAFSEAGQYVAFTFPYMGTSCNINMKLSALTADGSVIHSLTLSDVLMTRNRITTYSGEFFGAGQWTVTQTAFTFTVNGDWDGEDHYTF